LQVNYNQHKHKRHVIDVHFIMISRIATNQSSHMTKTFISRDLKVDENDSQSHK